MADQDYSFSLGNLIAPARNSQLAGLGYQIEHLGLNALGVVIERGKKKSLVHFPALNLQIWLGHHETKDVLYESKIDPRFRSILPENETQTKEELPWLVSFLITTSQAVFVLGINKGDLIEVWDSDEDDLNRHFQGDINTNSLKLSLGLDEWDEKIRSKIKAFLGDQLLFDRLLPSGMHKMEWSLYLKI